VSGFLNEFKTFAMRGSVVDLAVGVIIGAAFNSIISTLVDNVLMPPIGLLVGGVDFAKLQILLRPDDPSTEAVEAVAIQYGLFLNALIQFVLVAFAVFLLIKAINRLKEKEEEAPAAPAAPSTTEVLLAEIRDALRARK
jgi:large conductance mechanosensitive channel